MVTNWFSVAAGACFIAAAIYGALYAGQSWKILALYLSYAFVNFIIGTMK